MKHYIKQNFTQLSTVPSPAKREMRRNLNSLHAFKVFKMDRFEKDEDVRLAKIARHVFA